MMKAARSVKQTIEQTRAAIPISVPSSMRRNMGAVLSVAQALDSSGSVNVSPHVDAKDRYGSVATITFRSRGDGFGVIRQARRRSTISSGSGADAHAGLRGFFGSAGR